MKRLASLILLLALMVLCPHAGAQQTAAGGSPAMQKNIEAYLRHLYAFGPDVTMVVGTLKPSGTEGLLATSIDLTIGENKQTVVFYVSKDGKYLFRGDMLDMAVDPLAEARAKIDLKDAPTTGDAKAPVTLVEYSDFECPVCRSLHDTLRNTLPNYGNKVRVVFKDFPLEQIHPWARTAALGGRCTYTQDPKAFWKIYDFIYDNQEIISAENAWTKMLDYAGQIGLDTDKFKACMASPEAAAALNASHDNGMKLEVGSTPTVFVNGRRMVGADPRLLEQYINYELAQQKTGKAPEKK